jgi:DNA-binding transcriptional LysR family regulator
METKWLEDFVSLAETRSFSRSAQLRHVTQPAFSRRIQALEAWAGTGLIDRSSYPTRLTPAGESLHEQSIELLQRVQSTRAMLRGHSAASQEGLTFAVAQTLAFTFFPAWVNGLQGQLDPLKCRLAALSEPDAVQRLIEGRCDFLIAYQHPSQSLPVSQPGSLDPERYEMLPLGQELLAPYVKMTADGAPLFAWPGLSLQPPPYLAYAPGAYLGGVVNWLLTESQPAVSWKPVYEADWAESLKAMVLQGHGLAFLPCSAVQNELQAKALVRACEGLETQLTVCIYRERAGAQARLKTQALWDRLLLQNDAKLAGRLLACK